MGKQIDSRKLNNNSSILRYVTSLLVAADAAMVSREQIFYF